MNPSTEERNLYSHRQYEGYIWDNIPANILFSDGEKLKFKMRRLLADIFSDYFETLYEKDSDTPFWLENAYRKMRDPKNFIEGKEKLFRLAGKTREHTTRCMKKYYGITPSDYVNELRLSYAANLLMSSNLNATEICYECGFQNVSWFYNEFANFCKKALH